MLIADDPTAPPDGTTVVPSTVFAWTPGSRVAPTAVITGPAGGSSYAEGVSVPLRGTVTDVFGGAVTGTWTSSRDGVLGTGTALNPTTLTVGSHTITLSGTDSQGDAATPVSIALTITGVAAEPTVTLTEPLDSASVTTGVELTLKATATDTTSLTFKVDSGSPISGTLSAGVWSAKFTPPTDKSYSWTATATGPGGTKTSAARTFTATTAAPSFELADDFAYTGTNPKVWDRSPTWAGGAGAGAWAQIGSVNVIVASSSEATGDCNIGDGAQSTSTVGATSTIRARINKISEYGAAYLHFRCLTDGSESYLIQFVSGKWAARKFKSGVGVSTLSDSPSDVSDTWAASTGREVEIVLSSSGFTVKIYAHDGVTLIGTITSTDSTYTGAGRVRITPKGLSASGFHYDWIKVEA